MRIKEIVRRPNRPHVAHSHPLYFQAAIAFLVAGAILLLDLSDGHVLMLDVDDRMRALQIRLLASGQAGWFDLSIPAVRLPEVYVSPWSRLVDLPYVVIGWILAPLLGDAEPLRLAFSVWPLTMLAVFSLLIAVFLQRPTVTRGWRPARAALIVCVVTMMMGPALGDFSPGRIDHHNWQLIAMVCILIGLQRFDSAGGLLVGLSAAMSLIVGLECLPLIVVAYGALVICWLWRVSGAEVIMGAAGLGVAVASLLFGLLFVGPNGLTAAVCDSFSAPFALAAIGAGAMLFCLARWGGSFSILPRIVMFIAASAAVLSLVALLYPACLDGPYAMIGPSVRANWLDRIRQEHGLLFQLQTGAISVLPIVVVLCLVAVWAVPGVWHRRQEEPGMVLAFVVALAALVATMLQLRYARFSVALMPLFVPVIIGGLQSARREARRPILFASSALLIGGLLLTALVLPRKTVGAEIVDTMRHACDQAKFSALVQLPPGRVLAPHGLGLPLIEAGQGRLQVAAIPFHRAAPGLATVFTAFLSDDVAARRNAVENFDYVAVCALPPGLALPGGGMYAALIHGRGWPGLEEWSPGSLWPLRIFRIDHAHFR